MTDRAILCNELTTTLHRDIPLAAAMNVGVESFDGLTLTVRAPLPPNRNVHGTAFAGSLYSLCVLTGWGATWLAWRERALTSVIVVAASNIQYRRAVTGELVCRCGPDPALLEAAVEEFMSKGRASLALECAIDSDDKRAVTFTSTYVVHTERRLARRADQLDRPVVDHA